MQFLFEDFVERQGTNKGIARSFIDSAEDVQEHLPIEPHALCPWIELIEKLVEGEDGHGLAECYVDIERDVVFQNQPFESPVREPQHFSHIVKGNDRD